MGIVIGLMKQIRTWDTASKIALAIALSLLAVALAVLITVPNLRTLALISGAGLLIALQIIVLWGNRNMVTPHTQAQRHFMAGKFEQARDVLRAYIDERNARGKQPTIDSLVLLGNAYRNLGQLRESESILRVAVARQPKYHFALYGLGKTLLSKGDYDSALRNFETALEHGAPPVTRYDIALAHYYRGSVELALALLRQFPEIDEPHRQLMTAYLLHSFDDSPAPDVALIEAGLPFWEAEIERFANTPYAHDLQADVARLRDRL